MSFKSPFFCRVSTLLPISNKQHREKELGSLIPVILKMQLKLSFPWTLDLKMTHYKIK